MNRVELIGRISTDVKVLKFKDNKQMARFSVAVNPKNKDEKAEFFTIVAWEKLATVVSEHCKKGDRVGVSGALKTNHYTSTNGENWHSVEIYAHEIDFLETKKSEDKKLPF